MWRSNLGATNGSGRAQARRVGATQFGRLSLCGTRSAAPNCQVVFTAVGGGRDGNKLPEWHASGDAVEQQRARRADTAGDNVQRRSEAEAGSRVRARGWGWGRRDENAGGRGAPTTGEGASRRGSGLHYVGGPAGPLNWTRDPPRACAFAPTAAARGQRRFPASCHRPSRVARAPTKIEPGLRGASLATPRALYGPHVEPPRGNASSRPGSHLNSHPYVDRERGPMRWA